MKKDFVKYMHVEKWGNDAVQGIELGYCYVFPKLDGTNASVWLTTLDSGDKTVVAGSRNRLLTLENDNQEFYATISDDQRILDFFMKYPQYRLFGEWLVPHSLRTYRKDAWRKFYIFDVALDRETKDGIGNEYTPYPNYKDKLEEFGLDYLAPIAEIRNGSYEQFIHQLNNNVFLIEDGKGVGEGIVIKNYDFYNKYGRQVWAKIVTSEFKEKNHKAMGSPVINGKRMVEEDMVEKHVTQHFIDKIYDKIVNENSGWSSKYIPRLLMTAYYDLVNEHTWDTVKSMKYPTINFKTLQHFTISKVKELKKELF